MIKPYRIRLRSRWSTSLRHTLLHISITLLAVAIAFSLPTAARYVLYQWWPIVAEDANLLIATEVGLATALAILFNVAHMAWENRDKVRMADFAALVHVRHSTGPLARWRERRLVRHLPAARDSFVLTITGFDTFANEKSLLREQLSKVYEIRVMLLNPYGKGAEKRVKSLSGEITRKDFEREVESSIRHLTMLRTMGKKVTLKFYEREPFWKVVVLGEHVWVQYCHSGCEIKHEPEYVFSLNHAHPRKGFFVPFYMHFLEQWHDPRYPEYDFDVGQLIYRDVHGKEVRRRNFGIDYEMNKPAPAAMGAGMVARFAAANSGAQQAPAG